MDAVVKDAPYRGAQTSLIAVSVVSTAIAAIALLLRIIGRCVVVHKLGVDDWFMVAGMVFTVGYLVEILCGLKYGIGLYGSELALDHMVGLLKIIYAIQLTYNTIVALVKISIVCFYLRLATVDSGLRKGSWATLVAIGLIFTSTQIVTTLQCLPVESNWDLVGNVKNPKCISKTIYFYITAVVNILVDIVILLLPIRTLKNIKRGTRDKIVLFVIFGVGGFSCISSIIRLYTIRVFSQSKDPFFDGVPINIWSMIEINVAIVCASVPAMKPLFTKAVRDRIASSKSSRATRTGFNGYGHQMMPLDREDKSGTRSGKYREHKTSYIAKATSGGQGGSEEHIVTKSGGD